MHSVAVYKFFTTKCLVLMNLKEKAFEDNLKQGENGCNKHFLLFSQCFLTSYVF